MCNLYSITRSQDVTSAEEWDVWLRAPWSEAVAFQGPLTDAAMRIVAGGAGGDLQDTEAVEQDGPAHLR